MDATNHPLRGANIYFDGTTISTISYYLKVVSKIIQTIILQFQMLEIPKKWW